MYQIEKNVTLIKDARKGSKFANPLYQLAEEMKIGDSVRFNFSEFPGLPKKDLTLDESIEHNRQEREYEKTFNAPKKFKRYMIELHGKGSVAERNIYNIPGEEIKDGESGVRVWRIK